MSQLQNIKINYELSPKILKNYYFIKQTTTYQNKNQIVEHDDIDKNKSSQIKLQSNQQYENNPQNQHITYKQCNNTKLPCICQLCTCGQHKCPPISSQTKNKLFTNKYKQYKNSLLTKGINNSNIEKYTGIQQIKQRAKDIYKYEPYRLQSTYKRYFQNPNVNQYLNQQISQRKLKLQKQRRQHYKSMSQSKKVPYNPKFNKLQNITSYKLAYSANNIPQLTNILKNNKNIFTNSAEYAITNNFIHRYGRQHENIIKMKTQQNQNQRYQFSYRNKHEISGETEYKNNFRPSGQKLNINNEKAIINVNSSRRLKSQGNEHLPEIVKKLKFS